MTSLHDGYPLVDPVKGRPRLNWLYCAHEGCNKRFTYHGNLEHHLRKHNTYIPQYHFLHEQAVEIHKLTPESVKEKELSSCPSIICDDNIESPEDLIEHFTKLGIEPFWKPIKID